MVEQRKSRRSPLRFVVLGIILIAMIGVVLAGIGYMQQGVGGVVPFLMVVVAPMLAIYYVWYLVLRSDG